MADRLYLLTPSILANEMAMLAEMGDEDSEIVQFHDGTTFWWCLGHAVELPSFTSADLACCIDDFSRRFCVPAVQKWKAREGVDRPAYNLPSQCLWACRKDGRASAARRKAADDAWLARHPEGAP